MVEDDKKKQVNEQEVKEKETQNKQQVDESAAAPTAESQEQQEPEAESKEEILELEKKLEELAAEKEALFNKLQRLQADFINFRKRVEKEKGSLALQTKVEVIAKLLPVVDNFERALAASEEESEFKKGVEMIYRQLLDFLNKEGVKTIPTVGEPFDHNLHEAMFQVPDAEHESGTILEELQKGYILDAKVIRPAMVKVVE